MKKYIFATACIMVLASPAAFAQMSQPTGGASSEGNVGPGASGGAMKNDGAAMEKGMSGMNSRPSASGDASTSGAGTAAGANSTGNATEPGAVKDGVNKR